MGQKFTPKVINFQEVTPQLEETAGETSQSEAETARRGVRLYRRVVRAFLDGRGDGIAITKGGQVVADILGDWNDFVPTGRGSAA